MSRVLDRFCPLTAAIFTSIYAVLTIARWPALTAVVTAIVTFALLPESLGHARIRNLNTQSARRTYRDRWSVEGADAIARTKPKGRTVTQWRDVFKRFPVAHQKPRDSPRSPTPIIRCMNPLCAEEFEPCPGVVTSEILKPRLLAAALLQGALECRILWTMASQVADL
jgi:hypothetical protein